MNKDIFCAAAQTEFDAATIVICDSRNPAKKEKKTATKSECNSNSSRAEEDRTKKRQQQTQQKEIKMKTIKKPIESNAASW